MLLGLRERERETLPENKYEFLLDSLVASECEVEHDISRLLRVAMEIRGECSDS